MSYTSFKATQCHDDRPVLTQKDSIARCLSFAGIHDHSFATWIDEAMDVTTSNLSEISDGGNWAGEEGTWATCDGVLHGTGGGAARWYKIYQTTSVDLGYVATFDKTGNQGAFLFCSTAAFYGYLVWWTGTAVGVTDVNGATETVLFSLPCTETGSAAVTVAVRPQRYERIDTVDDLSVSLWFDNKLLLTHTMEYETRGSHIGFAVWESDSITFDNLTVCQLHQIIDWTSVDPGEAVASGIGRALGYDEIFMRSRYDGTVRVWRNTDNESDWTVPANRARTAGRRQDIYTPSHMRVVGALHEIDNFRTGTQGHIFAIGQDPNALSELATYNSATRVHRSRVEKGEERTVVLAPNPALEPEDIITYDGEKWRVTSISYRVEKEGSGYSLVSVLNTRECLDA